LNIVNLPIHIEKDSKTDLQFGSDNHLQIVGFVRQEVTNKKLYVVRCANCIKDPELFGCGLFITFMGGLLKGQIPCGCSIHPAWEDWQYRIKVVRYCDQVGYHFKGWLHENYEGRSTKVCVICPVHGEWQTSTIKRMLINNAGCPQCGRESVGKHNTKPDDVMIKSFMDSGAFGEGSLFWRSERLNTKGYKDSWCFWCPTCDDQFESTSYGLQNGKMPCGCSAHNQKYSYINTIEDAGLVIGLKFGITSNLKARCYKQNKHSVFDIKNIGVWKFDNSMSCKGAEKYCKNSLDCGVFSKEEVPDGWTETTHTSNIDEIISIYEGYGGIRITE
jgi:hypothetical protein